MSRKHNYVQSPSFLIGFYEGVEGIPEDENRRGDYTVGYIKGATIANKLKRLEREAEEADWDDFDPEDDELPTARPYNSSLTFPYGVPSSSQEQQEEAARRTAERRARTQSNISDHGYGGGYSRDRWSSSQRDWDAPRPQQKPAPRTVPQADRVSGGLGSSMKDAMAKAADKVKAVEPDEEAIAAATAEEIDPEDEALQALIKGVVEKKETTDE